MLSVPPFLEIHSRMGQGARTKAANTFKDAQSVILLSSDVAARGMDFPGVTLVLQTGLPASGEQYIHRLGQTARACAARRSVLILSQPEQFFMHLCNICGLPIHAHTSLPSLGTLARLRQDVTAALDAVGDEPKTAAYQAWLGYHKASLRELLWDVGALVGQANMYVFGVLGYKGAGGGMPSPIMARTVGKMGIRGMPGLNVVAVLPGKEDAMGCY